MSSIPTLHERTLTGPATLGVGALGGVLIGVDNHDRGVDLEIELRGTDENCLA